MPYKSCLLVFSELGLVARRIVIVLFHLQTSDFVLGCLPRYVGLSQYGVREGNIVVALFLRLLTVCFRCSSTSINSRSWTGHYTRQE